MVVAGTVLEQLSFFAIERRLGPLAQPYAEGRADQLSKLQRSSSLVGTAAAGTVGRRSQVGAAVGGALMLAGSAALRLCIRRARFQATEDPAYLVHGQS